VLHRAWLLNHSIASDVPMVHRDVFARFQEQRRAALVSDPSAIEHIGVPAINGRAVVFPNKKDLEQWDSSPKTSRP
jgi:hypothetical protein